MNSDPPPPPGSVGDEIPMLIETLLEAERRLEELTAGEVDSVAGRDGRTFLLRRAQEQLRHSEAAKQAAILNALPAHVALLDVQGLILSVNDAWRRFASANLSEGPADGIGRNYLEVCDRALGAGSSEARAAAAGIRSVLSGAEKRFSIEYSCHSPTDERWFLLTVTPLAGDPPNGAVAMHLDITERRRAEETLAQLSQRTERRERLLSTALSSTSDFAQIYDRNGRLLFANQPLLDLWGLRLDAVVGKNFFELGYPDDLAARLQRQLRQVVEMNLRVIDETPYTSPAGGQGYYEYIFSPVCAADGRVEFVVGSTRDVSERKRTEQALRESEERLLQSAAEYRLLFDSNPGAMWVFDVETLAFLAVNTAAVALYGFSRAEFLATTIEAIRPPEEIPALLEHLTTMADVPSLPAVLVKHRRKDGSIFEVAGISNPIEFNGRRARLVLANDVSERKLLEAQLLQAQKMDAVGRLAGGVAHDFNNSLGVILGYTELLIRNAGDGQRGKLEQVLKAAQRAAGLTRQLLAFSRQEVVDPKVVDLNVLLPDLEIMLGRLIGEDIDLVIVPGAELGQVKADPGQLEQVVMNLCVNARDAMPDGGPLRIETRNADVDAAHPSRHEPMAPGRYVVLSVADAGCGIQKDVLSKIFEPFFTTKALGKGTGLGLAMVYGIAKQAGGYVWVDSEVGRGTTFRIYLPRVDEPMDEPKPSEELLPPRGWETILLVEDEGALRAITREVLEEHGYTVVDAAGANEAFEIARRHSGAIHLLLTDVVMPGMNGRLLAEALVALRPDVKVLYMSGYTDDIIAHRGVLEAGSLLVTKPFTVLGLLARVRTALETGAASQRAGLP